MVRRHVPEAGDIVWLHFDPQAEHEQLDTARCFVPASHTV